MARGPFAIGWARYPCDSNRAADALITSKRTLARRIREVLGRTPVCYTHDLRNEHALHLLTTSSHNVDAIAGMVGYADGVTLLRRRSPDDPRKTLGL